jgi:hypothetical protein
MTFLPIVGRELLEASRRRGTYWMRLAAAAAGLIIGGWVMLVMRQEPPADMSIWLFGFLASAAYIYCLFVGVFRTADCLSEEKREGTLGLLFLTDLKGYDIVFGKLAATSLNAFYGVLALFPVMAIPLLVGGVTIAEFWRVVLAAMNTLFFSMAVGMFCSSISRDERRAMVAAFLIVLFFAGGIPLLAAICHQWGPTRPLAECLLIPSPGYAAVLAFESPFTKSPFNYFYTSISFTHSLSWILLGAASLIVPRTWQDKGLTAEETRRQERLNRLKLGSSQQRLGFRRRLLEINPFYWLVARQRMKSFLVWVFLASVALIWMLGLIFNPHDWKQDEAYLFTAIAVHTILKFWVVTEACQRFSLDRQSGALELLLSTPISVSAIVRGQWQGLERQFAGPVLAVLLADFVFLLAGRRESGLATMWVAGMIVFVADLLTLGWLGMWRGLNSRRPNRAAAAALVRVLVLPWMTFLLFMTFVGVTGGFDGGHSIWNVQVMIILWGVISLVFNAVFGLPARQRLVEEFRQIATQRFETRGR